MTSTPRWFLSVQQERRQSLPAFPDEDTAKAGTNELEGKAREQIYKITTAASPNKALIFLYTNVVRTIPSVNMPTGTLDQPIPRRDAFGCSGMSDYGREPSKGARRRYCTKSFDQELKNKIHPDYRIGIARGAGL